MDRTYTTVTVPIETEREIAHLSSLLKLSIPDVVNQALGMWLRRGEIPHFSAYERILLGNDTFLVNYTSVITALANRTDRAQTAITMVQKKLKDQLGSRAFTMSMTEIWLADVPESLDQSQAGIIEVLKTFDPEIKSFPIPEIW